MDRKTFLEFIMSICALLGLLSGIVLLIDVRAQAPQQRQIVFESNRDGGKGDIFVMDADGKNSRNLTNHPASDWQPAWSPDGRKIAFVSNRDGKELFFFDIYVMDADGKNLRNLTNHPKWDWDPAWSPDGKKIAYIHADEAHKSDIYVMDADGKNPHNLTSSPVSNRDGNLEIYVMDIDGNNQVNLTNHPAMDIDPDWFDPAFALAVSSHGKFRTTWGNLRR